MNFGMQISVRNCLYQKENTKGRISEKENKYMISRKASRMSKENPENEGKFNVSMKFANYINIES